MIQVTYYRSYNRITIQGHARSGEPGHDLVCAGVSTLAYTMAANVANLESQGHARNVIVKMEPGDAEISFTVRGGAKALVARIMEAVCVGFEILAKDYPEFISYEIHG